MRHHYLSDKNCAARLIEEYRKWGMIWVAYDFDNTVYDFHNRGHDYEEVIVLLRELRAIGCRMIVFTAEKDTAKVVHFLEAAHIPYDLINENPPFFRSADEARKIYWNVLLDDRAGLSSAYRQCKALVAYVATSSHSANQSVSPKGELQ